MAKVKRPENEMERPTGHGDEIGDDLDDEDAHDLTFTVPNDDSELLTFLDQLAQKPEGRDLYGVFADKLADRNDTRSDLIRDLATPGVCPEHGFTSSSMRAPMIAARFWAAYRRGDRVHAAVYPSTTLHHVIAAATRDDGRTWPRHRPATVVQVRVPARERTAEGFLNALDVCRVRLLVSMFGTSPDKLERIRLVRTSSDMSAVKNLLYGRQRTDTIPWLVAVYKSDRSRFEKLLTALLEDRDLRKLACEVMDVVEPEWWGLVATRLASPV